MIVVKHKSVKTEHQEDDAKNNANVQVSKNILSDRRKPPISHSAAPNRFAVNVLHRSNDDYDDDMYACMNMYDDDDDDYGGLDDAENNANVQLPNIYRGYNLNFICDDFDDDNEYTNSKKK
eukprot:511666_1